MEVETHQFQVLLVSGRIYAFWFYERTSCKDKRRYWCLASFMNKDNRVDNKRWVMQ